MPVLGLTFCTNVNDCIDLKKCHYIQSEHRENLLLKKKRVCGFFTFRDQKVVKGQYMGNKRKFRNQRWETMVVFKDILINEWQEEMEYFKAGGI